MINQCAKIIFTLDCLEQNLQAEMLGYKEKRKLLPGAVPTIFSYKIYEQINMDGIVVSNRTSSEARIKRLDNNNVSNMP